MPLKREKSPSCVTMFAMPWRSAHATLSESLTKRCSVRRKSWLRLMSPVVTSITVKGKRNRASTSVMYPSSDAIKAELDLSFLSDCPGVTRFLATASSRLAPVQHFGEDYSCQECLDFVARDARDESFAIQRKSTEIVDNDVSVNEAARPSG